MGATTCKQQSYNSQFDVIQAQQLLNSQAYSPTKPQMAQDQPQKCLSHEFEIVVTQEDAPTKEADTPVERTKLQRTQSPRKRRRKSQRDDSIENRSFSKDKPNKEIILIGSQRRHNSTQLDEQKSQQKPKPILKKCSFKLNQAFVMTPRQIQYVIDDQPKPIRTKSPGLGKIVRFSKR
ncbi:hypothetical protein pb186bvf_016561 [Paramecium bursaria]